MHCDCNYIMTVLRCGYVQNIVVTNSSYTYEVMCCSTNVNICIVIAHAIMHPYKCTKSGKCTCILINLKGILAYRLRYNFIIVLSQAKNFTNMQGLP